MVPELHGAIRGLDGLLARCESRYKVLFCHHPSAWGCTRVVLGGWGDRGHDGAASGGSKWRQQVEAAGGLQGLRPFGRTFAGVRSACMPAPAAPLPAARRCVKKPPPLPLSLPELQCTPRAGFTQRTAFTSAANTTWYAPPPPPTHTLHVGFCVCHYAPGKEARRVPRACLALRALLCVGLRLRRRPSLKHPRSPTPACAWAGWPRSCPRL
jgi:hypothetical protein